MDNSACVSESVWSGHGGMEVVRWRGGEVRRNFFFCEKEIKKSHVVAV